MHVSASVSVCCVCVTAFVCKCLCLSICLPACLPTMYVRTYMHSYLPTSLPACPTYLRTYLPTLTSLAAYSTYLHLPTHLAACLPAHLPTVSPARFPRLFCNSDLFSQVKACETDSLKPKSAPCNSRFAAQGAAGLSSEQHLMRLERAPGAYAGDPSTWWALGLREVNFQHPTPVHLETCSRALYPYRLVSATIYTTVCKIRSPEQRRLGAQRANNLEITQISVTKPC